MPINPIATPVSHARASTTTVYQLPTRPQLCEVSNSALDSVCDAPGHKDIENKARQITSMRNETAIARSRWEPSGALTKMGRPLGPAAVAGTASANVGPLVLPKLDTRYGI